MGAINSTNEPTSEPTSLAELRTRHQMERIKHLIDSLPDTTNINITLIKTFFGSQEYLQADPFYFDDILREADILLVLLGDYKKEIKHITEKKTTDDLDSGSCTVRKAVYSNPHTNGYLTIYETCQCFGKETYVRRATRSL